MTMSTLYGYRTADGTYVSPAEAEAEQQRERAGIVAAMRAAGVELNEDAEASLTKIDERAVEYAAGLDQVRLVQQEIRALDPENGTFADLAYGPAKESLLAEADPVVEHGMQVLKDLNTRRNEIAARG